MLSVLVLTVLLGIINRSIAFFEYSNVIVYESLRIYENPLFSLGESSISPPNYQTCFENLLLFLEVPLSNEQVYLNISNPITENNTLCLNISAKSFNGVQFPIVENFCDFLKKEAANSNDILSEFKFSRIFNMEGKSCPIPAGKKKLKPYVPPQPIKLSKDIGCGHFNFTITLGKCKNMDKVSDTSTYLLANIILDLQTENCTNIST